MEPIYDEIIEAPTRFKVKRNGRVNEIANLHVMPQKDSAGSNRTIGAIRNRASPGALEGLFDSVASQELIEEKIEEMKQRQSQELPEEEEGDDEDDPTGLSITASVLI